MLLDEFENAVLYEFRRFVELTGTFWNPFIISYLSFSASSSIQKQTNPK